MKIIRQMSVIAAIALVAPAVWAGPDRDCLLKGTVEHGEGAGSGDTMVKIHAVRPYDNDARCRDLGRQKMQFKLPADPRVQEAPSGSAVEYRYRLDDSGNSDAELISVGA